MGKNYRDKEIDKERKRQRFGQRKNDWKERSTRYGNVEMAE